MLMMRSIIATAALSLRIGLGLGISAAATAQDFDAAAVAQALTDGQTAEIQDARDDAVRYLSQPRLSVSDRLDAESALRGAIDTAIASGDEFRMINAVLVAGHLVTPTSLQAIEPLLTDSRPGVRYAAFKAMRESMSTLSRQASPSLQPAAAVQAFSQLVEAAQSEADPANIDAALRAIGAATTMRSEQMRRALTERALIDFASTAQMHLSQIPSDADTARYRESLGAVLVTVLELRTLLSDRGTRVDDAAVRASAELAGAVVEHVYDGFSAAGSIASIPEDRRPLMQQAIAAGEALIFFSVSRLDSGISATEIAGDFGSGDDRSFRAGALRLIGPGGVLDRNGIAFGGG